MARPKTILVPLNQFQIAMLPVIADLIEERAREPNNHKSINVNAHIIKKRTNLHYQTVKTNLLKLKDLKEFIE